MKTVLKIPLIALLGALYGCPSGGQSTGNVATDQASGTVTSTGGGGATAESRDTGNGDTKDNGKADKTATATAATTATATATATTWTATPTATRTATATATATQTTANTTTQGGVDNTNNNVTVTNNVTITNNVTNNIGTTATVTPTATATATNTSTSTATAQTQTPAAPTPKVYKNYLYIPNNVSWTISAYEINNDGTLSQLPSAGAETADDVTALTVTADGKYLYAANYSDKLVDAYSIDKTSGALTHIGTGLAGNGVRSLTTANGFLYAANFDANSITVFAIAAQDGTLMSVQTVQLSNTANPQKLVTDEYGHWLYVANYTDNNIGIYAIGTDGKLTFSKNVAAGNTPYALAINDANNFLYAVNAGSSDAWTFAMNDTTGDLTKMNTVSTLQFPDAITLNHGYAYVANRNSDKIQVFSVDQNSGALTIESAQATDAKPMSIAFDPTGDWMYVANYGDGAANSPVDCMTVSNGNLSAMAGSTAQVGSYDIAVAHILQ